MYPLLQKFNLVFPDTNLRCLGARFAPPRGCRNIRAVEFHNWLDDDEVLLVVVTVRALGPVAACLQCDDAGERDAADEVVGGELEGRVAQGTGDGVLELVQRERGEGGKDVYIQTIEGRRISPVLVKVMQYRCEMATYSGGRS